MQRHDWRIVIRLRHVGGMINANIDRSLCQRYTQTVYFDWCIIPHSTVCKRVGYTNVFDATLPYPQHGGVYWRRQHDVTGTPRIMPTIQLITGTARAKRGHSYNTVRDENAVTTFRTPFCLLTGARYESSWNCSFSKTVCSYFVGKTSTRFQLTYVFGISSLGELANQDGVIVVNRDVRNV